MLKRGILIRKIITSFGDLQKETLAVFPSPHYNCSHKFAFETSVIETWYVGKIYEMVLSLVNLTSPTVLAKWSELKPSLISLQNSPMTQG